MSIKITGLGIGLPAKIVKNEELAKIVETSDQWIKTRTGIEERRVCVEETIADLATKAALEALSSGKAKPEEIDFIICSTMQSDTITPSLCAVVQRNIGAKCAGFDLNMACCGFIYSLETAKNFILSGKYKKILIVCAEQMSKHVDWTRRETCVLFGDASSACIVESGDSLEYINLTLTGDDKFINHPTGRGNNPFCPEVKPQFLYLNGQEVYKFAVTSCSAEIEKGLKSLDITPAKIDNFILHQANKRIIDTIRESLKLPESAFPVNIQKYGNTSSVSILLLLYELTKSRLIKPGDRLFMVAFGGGLTSASCVLKWAL